MPSLIDLRRRIRAVKNTQQITKAMKMVAASKLRRAQERIMNARPYAVQMHRVARERRRARRSIGAPAPGPRARRRQAARPAGILVITVTADKGLCGSFNTNVIKGAGAFIVGSTEPCTLGLVGRKGRDFFARRGFNVMFEHVNIFQRLRLRRCAGDRRRRDGGFHRRERRSRDARVQRVQVRDLTAGRRRSAAADRARRRRHLRGRKLTASPGEGYVAVDYLLRAGAAGDFQPVAAALRRSAGSVGRCSSPTRRFLRRK